MTDSLALDGFLDKWRARWPEWRVAQVFLPEAQRDVAAAWFALLQEFAGAAWSGDDATPGAAKLAWWQEELRGWTKGARRHPLGEILQRHDANWPLLSAGLPGLQASRAWRDADDGFDAMASRLQPLARGVAECEAALFSEGDPRTRHSEQGLAAALFGEHLLFQASSGGSERATRQAQTLLARWPRARAARPRRIHEALMRARLRSLANGNAAPPLPPWHALIRSWRAARSA